MTPRGVSEVVGFALIFGTVLLSVGLIYAGAVPALEELRLTQQAQSADTAFQAAATGLEDLHRDRTPTFAIDLATGGGVLTVDDSAELSVAVDGETVASAGGQLRYRVDSDRDIAYTMGAVKRTEGEGALLTRSPPIHCSPEGPTIVTLVELTGETDRSSGPRTRVLFNTPPGAHEYDRFYTTEETTVTINYSQAAAPRAWDQHFRTTEAWTVSDGAATCQSSGPVIVRVVPVEVELVS